MYVEDGVPLRIRTDEEEDSIEVPQRRACPRAQISNIMTSLARIKYPMKRRRLEPRRPQWRDARSMRGALQLGRSADHIAAEMQKAYDTNP